MRHTLLEIPVTTDDVGVVIEQLRSEPGPQVVFGDRHAHRVRETLTEWPGRHLDAGHLTALGMSGGARSPLSEVLDLGLLEPVTGEMEHRVEEDGDVSARQDEAVAVRPLGGRRVVAHHPSPERVGERRERHRRSRVSRLRPMGRIHRETLDDVDGALLDVEVGHGRIVVSPPSAAGCRERW